MTSFYTRKGDDGYTQLLGEGRVPKYHLRPTVFGTVDEASASLGLARAFAISQETKEILQVVRNDLYHLMAELAAVPEQAERFRVLDASRVEWLETQIDAFEGRVEKPLDFVLSGDSPAAAVLDVARTIVRRAERLTVRLQHEDNLENHHLLCYLNRLSSMCFVLMLWEDHHADIDGSSLTDGEGV